jgi:hypothetical protein
MRLDRQNLSIADHGLIGDDRGRALVGRDGAIRRMSHPDGGGPPISEFVVAPERVLHSRQYYLTGTPVLVTEMRCPTGLVEVTDTFTLRSGADLAEDVPAARGELLRYVRVLEGRTSLRITVSTGLPLLASCRLAGPSTTVEVETGDELWLLLRWAPDIHRAHHVHPRRLLEQTVATWRRWSAGIGDGGPRSDVVRRSALTVKLLGCTDAGDAASLGSAFRRLGLVADADHVLGSVLDAMENDGESPGAAGDILDCAFQWAVGGGPVPDPLWRRLVGLVESAKHGTDTYSVAMHHVALDRAARLSRSLHLPGDAKGWSARAAGLVDRIVGGLGSGCELDPRLLALPARRVLPADHPRMIAAVRAIAARLDATPETTLTHGFRVADNLLGQGRGEEAGNRYDDLCTRANPLGLLPERIDTADGSFLGAFPDVSGHVAALSAGVVLEHTFIAGNRQ